MFHKYAAYINRPARSFLSSAVTGLVLCSLLLTFVVHFSLAWMNGQAATLVLGQRNFTDGAGSTLRMAMYTPYDVAIDPTTGKVFVADSGNNRVLRFASLISLSNGSSAEAVFGQPDFTTSTPTVTASGMSNPTGLTVDSSGRLWVADNGNSRVLGFDNAASKTNGTADRVLGQPDFTSNTGGTSSIAMSHPFGVATDSSGRLWVADRVNNRILRFDNVASNTNGAANGVLGQSDFVSNLRGFNTTGMTNPTHMTLDSGGRLWVADYGNSRVLRFDTAAAKSNGAAADGVLGQPDFNSGAQNVSATGMFFPSGVVIDGNGTLWVTDKENSRVLRFDNAMSKANGAAADGVLGQPDFTSNANVVTATGLDFPFGVTTDSANNVWVADTTNSRVLYFANTAKIDTIGIDRGGTFYLRLHNSTGSADIAAAFNPVTKPFPIVGDWTGAGFDTIGVYDQNTGVFSLRNSNTTGSPDQQLVFGNPNDTPLSGRWVSSATHAGVGVYRPSNGILYVQNALTTGFSDHALVLGNPGDQGVAGDWTGRGYDGLGIFRPIGNAFYLVNQVADGIVFSDINFLFGGSTDLAITGDWVAQGHDGVGTFRPTTGNVFLKNALTTGFSDNAFVYGVAGDQPIAGHWQAAYPPIAPHNNNMPAPILLPKTAVPQSTSPGNSAPGGNQIGG